MNTKKKYIKVLLVDDHPVVRKGIIKLLEDENEIVISGEAGSANEALKSIVVLKPDIVIVDINLGGQVNGIDLVNAIKKRFPEIFTIVLSIYNDPSYTVRAIKSGAKGYIVKDEAAKNIVRAIKKVMNGESFVSKEISEKMIDNLFIDKDRNMGLDLNVLTDREIQIFRFFGEGLTSKEISDRLNLSNHTIDSHRRNIRKKLKIESNNDLIKTAAQWVVPRKKK